MASFRKSKKDAPPEDPTLLPRALLGSPSTFFGAAGPPQEVVAAVPLLHALPPEALRPLLQQLAALLKGGTLLLSDDQFLAAQRKMLGKLEGLQLAVPFDGQRYGALFSGLFSLLRAAVRNKTPGAALLADLSRMHVPPAAAEDLARVVRLVRPDIECATRPPARRCWPT
jgi:hypothetical protein